MIFDIRVNVCHISSDLNTLQMTDSGKETQRILACLSWEGLAVC
jgi:hypothetical protein